jgi:AraC-like DNA-binding protein
LALLVLTIALWLIHTFFSISGIFEQDANYYFKPIYYSLAFGPLIFFYTRKLTNNHFQFRPIHLIHFIPVIFQTLLYWFLFFQDYGFKNWYWHNWHSPVTYRIEFIGTFISLAIYTLLSLRLVLGYQKWVKDNFSENSKLTLNWLRLVLGGFLILSVFWLIEVVLREVFTVYNDYTAITLGLMTFVLAMGGLSQSKSKEVSYSPEPLRKIELQEEKLQIIKARMDDHQDYLNPTLTLKEFANSCNLPSRTISEHLNQGLNKTFHDFVNEYRVEAVKKKLSTDEKNKYTLESIAYDCGFNSKATFNRIFKKFTGVTPGNYLPK